MSLGPEEHPRPEDLLSFADGELPSKESAAIRGHLDACWQCRTELEHQQAAIREFIDYRDQWVTPALPPRKQGFVTLRHKLREIPTAGSEASDNQRLIHRLKARRLRAAITPARAMATGLALAGFALLWYLARPLPSVSARELLLRASQFEEQPSFVTSRQTVRMHAGRHSVIRQVWHGAAVSEVASLTSDAEQVSAALTDAGWDPDDPLNTRNFRHWRDQSTRTAEVVKRSGEGLLTLTTSVSDTPLWQASLTVRVSDFHTVGQTLRFRHPLSGETAEISIEEVSWEPTTPPPTAVGASSEPATPPAPKRPAESRALPPAPEPSLDEQEANARWTLHRLGLDAGEPVEVKREGGRITVENSGLSAARLDELRAALPGVPIVPLRPSASSDHETELAVTAAVIGGQPLVSPLPWEAKFSSAEERTEFANRVVEKTEEALLHAHALARLTARYQPGDLQKLPLVSQGQILGIERDHSSAVCHETAAVFELLAPVLGLPSSSPAPSDEELLPVVIKIDRLANVLFARANTTLTADQAARDLAAALAEIQALCSKAKEIP